MKTDELDIGGGTVLNYTTVTSAAGFLRLVLDPGRLYRFLKHIPGIARYYGNFDVQQATCTLAISNQEPNSPVQLCDIVSNFFIARTASVLRMKGWDEYFKVGEHEDFFYRAKLAGLKVALVNDFATRHYPGAGKAYRLYRERAFELKRDFPKKFCFNAYKEINADDKSIIFSYKPDEERPRPLNDRP